MSRRRMLQLAAVLPLLVTRPALAGNVLETRTYILTLPVGWERNLLTDPVSARGSRGEILQISSSRIAGPAGETPELAAIRANIEAIGVKTLRLGEAETDLVVERPLRRTVVSIGGASGVVLNEVIYRSRESGWRIAQFSIVGPRTAILLSLRVPGGEVASIDAMREAIDRIQWVAP